MFKFVYKKQLFLLNFFKWMTPRNQIKIQKRFLNSVAQQFRYFCSRMSIAGYKIRFVCECVFIPANRQKPQGHQSFFSANGIP